MPFSVLGVTIDVSLDGADLCRKGDMQFCLSIVIVDMGVESDHKLVVFKAKGASLLALRWEQWANVARDLRLLHHVHFLERLHE